MTEVTQEDTFDAVARLYRAGYRPVALDFASASNPGGGWRGKQQGTQEENLCRRSNLGLLLEKARYPLNPDATLYVPGVVITNGPVPCAVIASELRGISHSTQQYLQRRVDAVYRCAVTQGHDVIVLGAWGCGAFKEGVEDPEILAREFLYASRRWDIKSVFAMGRHQNNYKIFRQRLVPDGRA